MATVPGVKIGLMGGNVSDDIFRKREAYTRIQLERAQQFAKALDLTSVANTLPKNISFLNVTGIGHKTLKRVYQLEEDEKMVFDVDHPEKYGLPLDPIMADGDKTVTLDSSEVPATLVPATTTIRTEYAHDRLFHDPKVHERFLLFLAKR